MRMLWADNRAQMLALRGDNPQTTGARHVKIALLIDLHPVERVLAFSRPHIEEDFSVRQRSIRLYLVPHDDLFLLIPVVYVEVLLVGRKCKPIRATQFVGQQLDLFPVSRYAEDTAVGQFFSWIVEELRESERRVGEIQRSVGLVDEVIGTVEPLSFVAVGQHRKLPVLFHANDPTIAVLVDGEPSLLIERETVGTGLTIFANVHPTVAAFGHEDRKLSVLCPTVNQVVVGIAEEKIAVGVVRARHPDRPLGKQESSGKFLDLRSGWNDLVQCRVLPGDLRRSLANRNFGRLVEIEGCRLDPDEVLRAVRNWPIDPEDGELHALAGLSVPGDDHAIGSVESFNHGPARLSQHPRHLAVNPDLGIVVDHNLKSDG